MGNMFQRLSRAIQYDRRFGAWYFAGFALLVALSAIGEDGWQLGLRIFVIGCFLFAAVSRALQYRRDGRWATPDGRAPRVPQR